jgi:hypothetical protein
LADSDDTPAYVVYGNILLPFGLDAETYSALLSMGGAVAQGAPGAPPVESILVLNARGDVIERRTTPAPRSVAAARSVAWVDPTARHLQLLRPDVRKAAFQLVKAARLQRLPVWISSSMRTAAHQTELVAAGRSLTQNSLHVRPAGQVAAFDIDLKGYTRDRVPMRVWTYLGDLGEQLGLRWGGRWPRLRDMGHFEGTGGFSSGPGF